MKIQLRKDTTSNWELYNPILEPAEVGVDLTVGKLKVGDGVKTWTQLDYIGAVDLSEYATTTQLGNETTARQQADNELQGQIDAITASSDVTDIVGTYAELQAYDTSKLTNDDIIKVLQDSTHNDETTYYRWVVSGDVGAFSLIGEEGPYYTKSQADNKFALITSLPGLATTSTAGLVQPDGTTITINDGVISGAQTYTLPPATTSTLGGVKVDGTTITIDNDDVISANFSTPSNIVTTDTTQDITGLKTFTQITRNYRFAIKVNNGIIDGYQPVITATDTTVLNPYMSYINFGNANSQTKLIAYNNITVTRGSNDYINIDSGNLSTYLTAIDGGNA